MLWKIKIINNFFIYINNLFSYLIIILFFKFFNNFNLIKIKHF